METYNKIFEYDLISDLEAGNEISEYIQHLVAVNKITNANEGLNSYQEKSTIGQVEYYLTCKYEFRRNIVNGSKEFRLKAGGAFEKITDYQLNSFWRELNKVAGIKCTPSLVENLLNSDFAPLYDPLVSYFESLPTWDGQTDYIQLLADTVETTAPKFWKESFRRWLVALVANIYDSEVVNQTVLVLSGGQNIGKTTWIRNLLPKDLRDYYYSGNINPRDKDTMDKLSQCALINLDELEGMKRNDLEVLKDAITKDHLHYRKVYQKEHATFIRRASFAATVNSEQFLTDPTGNRRFLCNRVTAILLDNGIDLSLVYSQAVALYKGGFKYWFDTQETGYLEAQNSQFVEVTPEEDCIMQLFKPSKGGEEGCQFYSSTIIASIIANTFKIPPVSPVVIGKIMTKLGFERQKHGGAYQYRVIRKTPNSTGVSG